VVPLALRTGGGSPGGHRQPVTANCPAYVSHQSPGADPTTPRPVGMQRPVRGEVALGCEVHRYIRFNQDEFLPGRPVHNIASMARYAVFMGPLHIGQAINQPASPHLSPA
jgi:hypothetical protein